MIGGQHRNFDRQVFVLALSSSKPGKTGGPLPGPGKCATLQSNQGERRERHGTAACRPAGHPARHRPGPGQGPGEAGAGDGGGSAALLPQKLRGSAEVFHRGRRAGGHSGVPGAAGGGAPPALPHPQGAGAGEGPPGGRHRQPHRHLLQPDLHEGRPAPRGDLHRLREGGGPAGAEADDQPGVRALGQGALHRLHPAGLRPDPRHLQQPAGRAGPAVRGRVRRAAGGGASRAAAPGARPGGGGVRLPEHPLPPGRGGPGAGPAAADL